MSCRATPLLIVLLMAMVGAVFAEERAGGEIELQLATSFKDSIQPFLRDYCFDCHGAKKQEAKLDLGHYESLQAVVQDLQHWEIVLERLEAKEMPPEDAERQPSLQQRQTVIDWIRKLRRYEADRHAGDPGPVLPRRLSNSEFDNTIRDLTGVDIRPTREFPLDPANEAGFDNSGESLVMSPALLQKYLAAAQFVADHLVLKPQGLSFAPHPVVTDTDRDKYCVQRIVAFYQRQKLDYADFFFAAWRYQHREALGQPASSLADYAAADGLSNRYLETIWSLLTDGNEDGEPLTTLRRRWHELPPDDSEATRRGCIALRDFVLQQRTELTSPWGKFEAKGLSNSSQPIILWKDRELALRRMLPGRSEPRQPDESRPTFTSAESRFCAVFPDKFFVSERGRMFLDEQEQEQGRLLSAGFHLMVGYFRDDAPLVELVLSEQERKELDALWQELDFIALVPQRQYKDFVFFERAEPPRFMQGAQFDFARSEDRDVISAEKMQRLREAYLAKVRSAQIQESAIQAIEAYFDEMTSRIRLVEKLHRQAEASHLESLLALAARAYRRPLSDAERTTLIDFYHASRAAEMLSHEDALRDALVSVLVSPHFSYRIDVPAAGAGIQPLTDYALASRLSYFLWASMPDEELLQHAAAGDLHLPEVRAAQSARMLHDPRIRGLAVEFGGHWLDFRRFEQFQSVDRERFATFTDELRQAMFEEPIRFFMDVVQRDGTVLDFLYANHTFVNPVLAAHYGMPLTSRDQGEWLRVDDARQFGRGGLLPMSVFMTGNSHPLRTSPVKRGYWVVRRLLGERIPPPPPQVPELPKDEQQLGDATLRELLAQHRDNKSCAACHERFDSLGVAFEEYGPIGERREMDLGGRPVDTRVMFPDNSEGVGLAGLRNYISAQRQDDFLDNLCRKLLAYALGRTLILSDDATVQQMRSTLEQNEYKFSSLITTIVSSPQFLNRRGREYDKAE